MQKILLTIIGVLSVTVCVLGYDTYYYAHRRPTFKPSDLLPALKPFEDAYEQRALAKLGNRATFQDTLQTFNFNNNLVVEKFLNGHKPVNIENHPIRGIDANNGIRLFKQDQFSKKLESVWVDDTTIFHFAWCLFNNKDVDTVKADGIRLVMEKYADSVYIPTSGTWIRPGDYGIVLYATKQNGKNHTNWSSDKIFGGSVTNGVAAKVQLAPNDAPPADNFNDPCPPSTNCNN